MNTRFIILTLISSLILAGCIWIDDDGGDVYIPTGNAEEEVVYINNTGKLVDNYIDDELVGSVSPYDTMRIYSIHLDGTHSFYSQSRDLQLTWGPTMFTLGDGEIFTIYLEETGMKYSFEH